MIQFKLNGNPLQIASCWEDLTLNQYFKILNPDNDLIKVISILTGIEVDLLNKAKITGLDQIIQTTSFLKTAPNFSRVTFEIGPYKLPLDSKGEFNIQYESLGQFEDMRLIMVKSGETPIEILKSYASYVSIYLQKVRDKEYDYDKAKVMIDEVMDMPAHQVISLGSFFLIKLLILLNGTQTTSQSIAPTLKKSPQGLAISKESSDPTARSHKSLKR